MIEGGILPIKWIVAGFTGSSISPIMLIILLVAGVAIFGRALETFGVAALAGHIYMFALQLEICQAVVKLGRLPASGSVANATVCAKSTCVSILRKMAGSTFSGCALQVGDGASVKMAGGTLPLQVRSSESKGNLAMVEVAITVDTVVTFQACITKIMGMRDAEIHVDGAVTIIAGTLIKRGNALGMTVCAGEGGAVRSFLMPGEGKAGLIMREVH